VTVRLRNQVREQCTFRLRYVAAHLGLDEHVEDVPVDAGEELEVDVPCGEILGLGPLEEPGGVGCRLSSGQTVENTMAVPAFLSADYSCGGSYGFQVSPDSDDLDEDGDTAELVCQSDALQRHMHQHRYGCAGGDECSGGNGTGSPMGKGRGVLCSAVPH
jgi:hypothetical protein